MSFSGSGTSGSIHSATDVALSNPQTSHYLEYNATIGKWQNSAISASQITDLTTSVQAIVASFLAGGSGVTLNYDHTANTLTIGFNGTSAGTGTGTGTTTPTTSAISLTNLWKPVQQVSTYLNTHPELSPIAAQPQAKWVLGSETLADYNSMVSLAAGSTIVLCIYAIPGRDSGGYSSGGFSSRAAYLSYISTIVSGIGSAPAIVILEPDALGLANGMSSDAKAERIETLRQAVDIMATMTNAEVYVDASMWIGTSDQANLLNAVDVNKIAGFALNVSGFNAQSDCYTYGDSVISSLNSLGVTGKKYVIDSSRNGNGPLTTSFGSAANPWLNTSQPWCNPPGRALGVVPGTTSSSHTSCRANLWVKDIGESDGAFPSASQSAYFGESAPAAGTFWVAYARDILGYSPQVPATPVTAQQINNVVSTFSDWTAFPNHTSNTSLVNGRARIIMTSTYESIQTASSWTLVSSAAYAHMYPGAAPSGSTTAQTCMVLNATTAGTRLRATIDTKLNTIVFSSEVSYYDQAAVSIGYDATAHAFVRLREASGTLYFETSPDASTWTARRTIATPSWVHATGDQNLQFFAYADSGSGYSEIDNVNTTS